MKLFDVEATAERLGGVSPWSVRQWLSQGKLERTKIGRRTMVSEEAIERFIREQNEQPVTGVSPNSEEAA